MYAVEATEKSESIKTDEVLVLKGAEVALKVDVVKEN